MTSKRAYVDGFVLPVPRAKLEEYRAMAQMCGRHLQHDLCQRR